MINKTLITGFLIVIFFNTKAQNNTDSIYIKHYTDIMTDKEYFVPSKPLICLENSKRGFAIHVSLKRKGKNNVVYSGYTIKSMGIGNCLEHDEVIILFEDGTKYSEKSWNDFNCNGNSYYDINGNDFDDIKSKKIKAIRFTNGRSYESFTYNLKSDEAEYFMKINEALEKNSIVVVQSLD